MTALVAGKRPDRRDNNDDLSAAGRSRVTSPNPDVAVVGPSMFFCTALISLFLFGHRQELQVTQYLVQ